MIKNLIFILFFLFCNVATYGQQEYSFTMDEAVSFAMENNKNSKNASKDILISQKEKWETIAIGLPQITSFFEFNNQTISLTTFFNTVLLTPPLLFVRRDEPSLITIFLLCFMS